ncbi:MAG: hypothetical protein J0I07_26615 [Myxococcales bacterium]|nr:hypothetical protein [Myxococcales bacterium]
MRHRSWGLASTLAVGLIVGACSPRMNLPDEPLKTPTSGGESFGGRQCSPVRPLSEPDLMAWDPGSRANLKRIRQDGLVVVRYHAEGCVAELELLPNCSVGGAYKFSAYSANERKVASTDDELFAELPLGAARLQGKLKGNRSIRTDYMLAGLYALPRGTSVQASDLSGLDCARATHVVSTIYVGAFVMGAGESRTMQGSLDLLGAGGGARSVAEIEVLGDEGNIDACKASQRDGKEDDRCGVPLRIGLVPLASSGAQTSQAGPPAAPKASAPSAFKESAEREPARQSAPPPATASREVGSAVPPAAAGAASCTPADWSNKPLKPLLRPGSKPNLAFSDQRTGPRGSQTIGKSLGQQILSTRLFVDPCTDSSSWSLPSSPIAANSATVDGVSFSVLDVKPAGKSGRGWAGGKCSYGARLANGAGKPVVVNEANPFNGIGQVVRSGSAVFMSMNFNGYAREFPQGGNNVIALDACDGTVKWRSPNLTSSGPIMLLGDYLVTGYGFTGESHYVYVLNAHTGAVVQKLLVPKTPEEFAIKNGVLVASLYEGQATFELLGP